MLKIVLLPFIILTLGVVYLLIKGLLFKLTSKSVLGFRERLPSGVIGSILLSIVEYALNRVVGL